VQEPGGYGLNAGGTLRLNPELVLADVDHRAIARTVASAEKGAAANGVVDARQLAGVSRQRKLRLTGQAKPSGRVG
jgi:hypothetical protein